MLLKAVLQVHKQLDASENKLPYNDVLMAEVKLRNDIMQDLEWKKKEVINLGFTCTLAIWHTFCHKREHC